MQYSLLDVFPSRWSPLGRGNGVSDLAHRSLLCIFAPSTAAATCERKLQTSRHGRSGPRRFYVALSILPFCVSKLLQLSVLSVATSMASFFLFSSCISTLGLTRGSEMSAYCLFATVFLESNGRLTHPYIVLPPPSHCLLTNEIDVVLCFPGTAWRRRSELEE